MHGREARVGKNDKADEAKASEVLLKGEDVGDYRSLQRAVHFTSKADAVWGSA